MKKTLLASLLLFASLSQASESTAVSDQTFTNDIINSTNKLDFVSTTKNTQVSGQLILGNDLMIMNIPMSFRVVDQITVDVNVPIINLRNSVVTGLDSTDIGDISLAANYRFGDYKAENGLHLLTLRYKGTTGNALAGFGTGKPSYTLAYNFAKDLSALRLNAYGSYTINDSLVLGDSLSLMAGGSHKFLEYDNLRTNVKISYLDIAQEGALFGYTQANIWFELSSKTLVEGMHLGAGVKFPLIDDINLPGTTIKGTNGFMFYLSTANLFPQKD